MFTRDNRFFTNVIAAALLLLAKHRYGAAVEKCWEVLTLEARFWPAKLGLGLSCFGLGMPLESAAELKNAMVCSGRNPLALALLAHLYWRQNLKAL